MPKRKTLLRLTISFVILVLAIVSLTVFLLYTSSIDQISIQLLRRVRDAAVISARLAESSEVRWEWRKYSKSKSYNKLLSQYDHIVEAMGLDDVYIIDKQMKCYLDIKMAKPQTAEDYVHILSGEFERAFNGEVILSSYYPKKTKTFISAYAPIFDNKGKVAFLAGVDLDVSSSLGLITHVQYNVLIILGVTVLASLLMSAILSYTIVTPIKNMVVAAEQIGLGNFEIEVPVSGRDELGFLGQTMNDMVEDIQQRDMEIKRLSKIVIDDLSVYNNLIMEGMLNGVLTFDLEGKVQSINPAACRILNENEELISAILSKEEAVNLRDLRALKGVLLSTVEKAVEDEKLFQNLEVKIRRVGKKDVLVSSDISPLIDSIGNNIGYMLFLTDVTKIRKLESKIKLKEKLAAIGELSAGIAHEIRNPLNSIELFLGLLQRKLKGQEDRINLVSKVRDEITKLNKILSDFLKFARPMPLSLSLIDLKSVIDDSIFFAKAELDRRQVDIRLKMPDDPVEVRVDSAQVQQVFTNIILNAAQAIGNGGLIEITLFGRAGDYRTVSFEDNGPGIPPEDIARIFNPFFTTKDEGTGLGLAMAHKIVETHGGGIEVESDSGGTRFTVTLPSGIGF